MNLSLKERKLPNHSAISRRWGIFLQVSENIAIDSQQIELKVGYRWFLK